jgi:hypothetical protein
MEEKPMIMTNKLLPVALIAALIGGSVGALIMHRSQPATSDSAQTLSSNNPAQAPSTEPVADSQDAVSTEFPSAAEQTAYKTGFADGFNAATKNETGTTRATRSTSRVVYRNASTPSSSRRVYYDYNRSNGRSFWQKHRDKLTVAIGTGAGAAVGGLIGGKKGAAIGALSGAGGSALYTYKLRKRNQ